MGPARLARALLLDERDHGVQLPLALILHDLFGVPAHEEEGGEALNLEPGDVDLVRGAVHLGDQHTRVVFEVLREFFIDGS